MKKQLRGRKEVIRDCLTGNEKDIGLAVKKAYKGEIQWVHLVQ